MTSRLVKQIPVTNRRLVTIPADHYFWEEARLGPDVGIKGALVRVYPAAHILDDELDGIKKQLLAYGAVAVRMMPRPKDVNIVKAKMEKLPGMSARETVHRMIEESNSADKDTLTSICSQIMDQVGL